MNHRTLSTRQRQVFDLMVQGRSNKEIARTLRISEFTVKEHVTALFDKLGVRRRAAAVAAYAWTSGVSAFQTISPPRLNYGYEIRVGF
jgi:DNA-binding NarL/FixJ family response regulator